MLVSINSFVLQNKPLKWLKFLGGRLFDCDSKLLYEYMEKDGSKGFFITDTPSKIDSEKICNRCDDFKCGYMLVRMLSGSFAYIRESDGALLPYRFAFASEFNESGYAMVGTHKGVSWINTNFDFIASNGKKYKCDSKCNDPFGHTKIRAFNGITSFEGEDRKISVLFNSRESSIIYFDSEKGILKFVRYDGEEHEEQSARKVAIANLDSVITKYKSRLLSVNLEDFLFNSLGYVVLGDKVLFSKGYFCTLGDLAKISCDTINGIGDKGKKFFMKQVDEKK